jgi:DNA-binding MarR family transcriptional regulator
MPEAAPQIAPERISDATLRGFVGYAMKRAFNTVQADVNATLAPLELRMLTFSALVVIVDNPGLRQNQLADALAIERPNLVQLLDELEGRGLVVRNRAAGDRRAYALMATPAGVRLCGKAIAAVQAHEARMTAGLDDSTRATVFAALQKIEAAREGQP